MVNIFCGDFHQKQKKLFGSGEIIWYKKGSDTISSAGRRRS